MNLKKTKLSNGNTQLESFTELDCGGYVWSISEYRGLETVQFKDIVETCSGTMITTYVKGVTKGKKIEYIYKK